MLCFIFLLVRRQHELEQRRILSLACCCGVSSAQCFFSGTARNSICHGGGRGGRGVARAEPLRLVNRVIVMVVTYFPLLCTTSALLASYLSNPDDILKERWAYLHLSDVTVGSKVELGPSTVSPHNSKPIYLYHVRC